MKLVETQESMIRKRRVECGARHMPPDGLNLAGCRSTAACIATATSATSAPMNGFGQAQNRRKRILNIRCEALKMNRIQGKTGGTALDGRRDGSDDSSLINYTRSWRRAACSALSM
jgi:hypothetical protein